MENQPDKDVSHTNGQLTNIPTPRKYGVFQSLQEMLGTAQSNPVSFTLSLVITYVLSGIILFLTVLAMTSLLIGQFGLLFASFSKIITVLIVGLIVYTLLYALVYAFTVSSIALSLSSEKNDVGTVLKKAIAVTPRIAKVNAWVVIIAYWPLAVAAFLPLLLTGSTVTGGTAFVILTPILVLVALIWTIIAQLRYALAPYVALFEPEVPVVQTLKRSQELLKNGGQWFIFKGVLMILAIFIILGVLTGSSLRELETTDNWTINVIFVIVSILVEGALVMLYFNRAGKNDQANTRKSPKLLALVIVALLGLLGLAAYQGQSGQIGGSYSQADREALLKSFADTERRANMKSLASALENFYNQQGYYPASSDVANSEWVTKNLQYTIGDTTLPIEIRSLTDPNMKYINTVGSDYQYNASPDNCTKCASFVVSAKLDKGDEFKQSSFHKTVKPSVDSSQTQTTTPQTQIQTSSASPTGKIGIARETYEIAADGSSAQLSPVTTILSDVASVELTVDLQCLGTCQFKLVSDTFNFSNTTTYMSSQKIKYFITKPGEHVFYNQFIPNAKFKVKF